MFFPFLFSLTVVVVFSFQYNIYYLKRTKFFFLLLLHLWKLFQYRKPCCPSSHLISFSLAATTTNVCLFGNIVVVLLLLTYLWYTMEWFFFLEISNCLSFRQFFVLLLLFLTYGKIFLLQQQH